MRTVVHLVTADPAAELGEQLPGPEGWRVVAFGPRAGGVSLRQLRELLATRGRVRLSGTPTRIYADVDQGSSEAPLIALDMIGRSDAAGLERAILSALPLVDEVVIGIDARGDAETRAMAEAYADRVHIFGAAELGMDPEHWEADRMDFAGARNLGRALIRAPWALVIDSDEYVRQPVDVRQALRDAGADVAAFDVTVLEGGGRHRNHQRLARTEFRWWSAIHNQLATRGRVVPDQVELEVVHDRSLRAAAETTRRDAQRSADIEQLREAAAGGEINALFHLAAHLVGVGSDEGVALVEDYRLRLEIEGPLRDQRAQLAMQVAAMYYNRDDLDRADLWSTRVLLDGPRPEAMCLKGDIAEDRGDLRTALGWYEAACVLEDVGAFQWRHVTSLKWGRRAGLRRALGLSPLAA